MTTRRFTWVALAVFVGLGAAAVVVLRDGRPAAPASVKARNDALAAQLREVNGARAVAVTQDHAIDSEGEVIPEGKTGSGRRVGYVTSWDYVPVDAPRQVVATVEAELRALGFAVSRFDATEGGQLSIVHLTGTSGGDMARFSFWVDPTSSLDTATWHRDHRPTAIVTSVRAA
ncbi:MAG TPA: hypothetical protein VM938_13045 [Acidimicrobiales bacterium]|nr:hypothetical protein [Acidimicrobiales bacterium]